jgi:hypothetical protein
MLARACYDLAVKHATSAALKCLSGLLRQIRLKDGLTEKTPGVFYRRSKAFLHFHQDPKGLFADLRAGADFDRYPVNTQGEIRALLSAIDRALGDAK